MALLLIFFKKAKKQTIMSNLALESDPVMAKQLTILDHLPIAILIADNKGNLNYYNQEADAIFSHDVLKNTKLTELSDNFNAQDLNNAIDSLNTNSQFRTQLYFNQKEMLYQLNMIKNPHENIIVKNRDDYLFTLSPVNIDLSLVNKSPAKQKPLAYKKPSHTSVLKKNFKELKQFSRLSAMREISSNLADKLNQPLTAILSYTQAMQRLYKDNASSDEINNAMQRVVINAENAGEIIRKVRSQLKVNTLNYQMICINDLIQESIHLTELDNPTSQIKLITNYEAEFTSLCIDKIQFRQVIFSLLNNALDAVLDYSIQTPEIAEEVQNKLFEPFNTTKKMVLV